MTGGDLKEIKLPRSSDNTHRSLLLSGISTSLDILSAAANRSRESLSRRSARALSTFPGQHHPVPYGQADILNARVGLDETVKGDDGLSISILGIYHFAAPQNIVADDQPARLKVKAGTLRNSLSN